MTTAREAAELGDVLWEEEPLMRADDKRRTCRCGHRYHVHAKGGTRCLAVVDDWAQGGDQTRTYQCPCHGWDPR